MSANNRKFCNAITVAQHQHCILAWCLHRTPKFFPAPCNTSWKSGRAYLFQLVLAWLPRWDKLGMNHSLCYKYEPANDSTGKFQSSVLCWRKSEYCWVNHQCLVTLQRGCGVIMALAWGRRGLPCYEKSILQDRRF